MLFQNEVRSVKCGERIASHVAPERFFFPHDNPLIDPGHVGRKGAGNSLRLPEI